MSKTVHPHLSPLQKLGELVFLSGQLPLLEGGTLAGDTIEAQTRQCLVNLAAVLARTGLGPTDILKTTVWLKRIEDFAGFNAAYAEFFSDHRPARSTVRADLVVPGALVEIECIASNPR